MNPKQFLVLGGIILVLVGILGFVGLIGPTSDSLFGGWWYFDNAENWAHLVLGVVALIAAYAIPASVHKPLVIIVGIVALLAGLYSIAGSIPTGTNLLGAQLQNPLDTILHLAVGAWALWASFSKKEEMSSPAM